MNELLPLGSIVELKSKTRYMIIGFLPSSIKSKIFYDYIVCNPDGFTKRKEELKEKIDYYFIKKEEIDNVLFIGLQDNEFDLYQDILKTILEKIHDSKQELTEKELYNDILKEMKKRWLKNEK